MHTNPSQFQSQNQNRQFPAPPSLEGPLWKLSSLGNAWNARHFILKNYQFVYGVEHDAHQGLGIKISLRDKKTPIDFQGFTHGINIIGEIQIKANYSVFERDDLIHSSTFHCFPFELHNPASKHKSFVFAALTHEIRVQWIAKLRATIDALDQLSVRPQHVMFHCGSCGQKLTVKAAAVTPVTRLKCTSCSMINRLPETVFQDKLSQLNVASERTLSPSPALVPTHTHTHMHTHTSSITIPTQPRASTPLSSTISDPHAIAFTRLSFSKQIAHNSMYTLHEAALEGKQVACYMLKCVGMGLKVTRDMIELAKQQGNLCRVIAHSLDPSGRPVVVTERSPLGTLASTLSMQPEMSLEVRLALGLQVCQAMECLEAWGVPHSLLTTDCIWLWKFDPIDPSKLSLKVSDYFLEWRSQPHTPRNTARWLAPELLSTAPATSPPASTTSQARNTKRISSVCDVWSMGCVLAQLMSHDYSVPFSQIDNEDDVIACVLAGGSPLVPEECDDELKRIIASCLKHHPSSRPTFADLTAKLQAAMAQATQLKVKLEQQQQQYHHPYHAVTQHQALFHMPAGPTQLHMPVEWQCLRCHVVNAVSVPVCVRCGASAVHPLQVVSGLNPGFAQTQLPHPQSYPHSHPQLQSYQPQPHLHPEAHLYSQPQPQPLPGPHLCYQPPQQQPQLQHPQSHFEQQQQHPHDQYQYSQPPPHQQSQFLDTYPFTQDTHVQPCRFPATSPSPPALAYRHSPLHHDTAYQQIFASPQLIPQQHCDPLDTFTPPPPPTNSPQPPKPSPSPSRNHVMAQSNAPVTVTPLRVSALPPHKPFTLLCNTVCCSH
eukprot:c13032_g2_i2.p1 GENE.c13032_g2_i2~~c13032_g2_i2.p1  ORF type:complete len:827 (-),score=185.57 c13032_g2_i2:646-3126(-)